MDDLSNKNVSSKYTLFSIICVVGLFGFAKQTQAETSVSPFNCVPSPTIQPPPVQPPGLTKGSAPVKSSLNPVCPMGTVPQPVIKIKNKNKGLPPQGSLLNHSLYGYHYVYAFQYATAVGGWANFSEHQPYVDPADDHSLAEIAAQSSDGQQIVENGWTVSRSLNGDDSPHLFVFSWVNLVPNCYNGCGYIQYSPSVYPGMTVANDGSQHFFGIEYYQGNWWLNYDGEWFGYFPESIWNNSGVTFNQVGLTQWFGEVSANGGSYTQMGNGIFGSLNGSASINNTSLLLDPYTSVPASWNLNLTDASCFDYNLLTPGSTFTYGGPGC